MAEREQAVREAAKQHGLSESAVGALWDSLERGGGKQAQFNHPDLGGMGQWSGGGMVQIGDMFNNDLKSKVSAACSDLAEKVAGSGSSHSRDRRNTASDDGDSQPAQTHRDWWPEGLGRPSTSGSQNAMRYAYFPDRNRLAIEENGKITLYDTGHHKISGVSQGQSRTQDLAFTSQDGPVDLKSLQVVET